MWLGLILVLIGGVFLLENLGILAGDAWEIIWPVIIIIFGFSVIYNNLRRR